MIFYNMIKREVVFRGVVWIALLVSPLAILGCSSLSNNVGESGSYVANDEMLEGPGLFTGAEGAFNVVGGADKKVSSNKSVSAMNVEETTQAINKKIKQLDQDKLELEMLKRQLNNKSK